MSVLGNNDEPTMEDMNKLPYLEMVIKETLRRFSMGPVIFRKTTDNLKLSEYMTI
jgi:cytochrome P450